MGWERQAVWKRDRMLCGGDRLGHGRTWAVEGVQGKDWGHEGAEEGHKVGVGEGMRKRHWNRDGDTVHS